MTKTTLLFLASVLLIAILIAYVTQTTPPCVLTASGDLTDEIESISEHMPGADSDGMVVPTAQQMVAWQEVLQAILDDELATACDIIESNRFPYHIVHYRDRGHDSTSSRMPSYLILKESLPISVGWGTYLIRLDEPHKNVIIEVPHPQFDLQTDEQGVALLRGINARALLMAGTHRCANRAYSPDDHESTTTVCGKREPYRQSDLSHATQSMFHVAHQLLVSNQAIALQLHGHGKPACPDLFISNTTDSPNHLTNQLYRHALNFCGTFSVDMANGSDSACLLTGSRNVQGAHSNLSPNRFIHLEQSRPLRQHPDCLIEALNATIP